MNAKSSSYVNAAVDMLQVQDDAQEILVTAFIPCINRYGLLCVLFQEFKIFLTSPRDLKTPVLPIHKPGLVNGNGMA